MPNNRFLLIVPFRNAESWIGECITSLKNQSLTEFRTLVIDDASTDSSLEQAKLAIGEDHRFTLIRNNTRRGAVYNKTIAVQVLNPEDDEIVMGIDGDDYLLSQGALYTLNAYFWDELWLTYGNFVSNRAFEDYGQRINWNVSIRKQPFCYAPPRACRWFLLRSLSLSDLTDSETGEVFLLPEDWVLMFPLVERAGPGKVKFLEDRIYFYRITDQQDLSIHREEGDRVRKQLLLRPPLSPLTKEQLLSQHCSWPVCNGYEKVLG